MTPFPASAPALPRPPSLRRFGAWVLSVLVALAALLAPALWNGWPLVFFDTAGYILRVLTWELEPGRSLFYGLFLYAASLGWTSLWGPVLVQAGLTLWLVHLLLRCQDRPSGPLPTAAVTVALSLLTGIAWYTAQLMPDALVPLLVLVMWLLGFRWDRLSAVERAGLAAVGLLALLSHMSSMALAIGLVAVTAAAAPLVPRLAPRLARPRLLPPAALVGAGLVLMPLLHLALVGKATFTPGGPVFVFGRLVQDGVAQRFLAEHCPDPAYTLCNHQDRLPRDTNWFIWHPDSPFRAIGWWGGADAELSRLTAAALKAYPGWNLALAAKATGDQLLEVETGDGLDEWQEVTRWVMRQHLPWLNPGFSAARQQQEQTTQALFDALNRVHVPVAHLSMLALAALAVLGARRGRPDLAVLALFLLLALLGNAFINGALSNPHDRYQSRVVWLATLAVLVALLPARPPVPRR